MSSTLSEDQKAYALEQTEKLRWGYGATSLLRIVATAAGYGFSAAGNPLLGTLVSTVLNTAANLADNYLDKSLAYYAAGGQGTYLRWILDPSGYVYDAYTNERLQGVTVTAYWIEYVEGDLTFWDRVPTDTEYGTLWNATEYSQQNPLLTDSNGGYAWDVPEGWWRVKYEKTGYETVWSHWMTVPPVQTDVNIGMTATEKPEKYISYDKSTKTVTITSNQAYSNAEVFVAAYSGGKLISLKSQTKNIANGNTIVTFADFDTSGADTVKVMVWQSAANLKPLFNVLVTPITK